VGDIEGVKRSEAADFQRGDAVDGVIDRTGGAGEVENVIDFANVEGFADVFFDELESRFVPEMVNVCSSAGEQVVDDNYAVAFA
jgi:hypothetical protein